MGLGNQVESANMGFLSGKFFCSLILSCSSLWRNLCPAWIRGEASILSLSNLRQELSTKMLLSYSASHASSENECVRLFTSNWQCLSPSLLLKYWLHGNWPVFYVNSVIIRKMLLWIWSWIFECQLCASH